VPFFPSEKTIFNLKNQNGPKPVRVFKNKHQAVSQGAWRFGKRSISADM
jgi:hypothetical protein